MPEENAAIQPDGTALPMPVRVFLSSDAVVEKRLTIFKDNGIAPLDTIRIGRLLNRIYDKEIPLGAFYGEISKLLPDNGQAAKKLALDLAGNELLSASDHLGDVGGLIRDLGGDPRSYGSARIILREMKPTEVVTETLHENPVDVPAQLEHRLREIMESLVRGVRKEEEAILRLTRAEKIGGAEMDEKEARNLVQKLSEKIAAVKIVPDEPPPPPAPPAAAPTEPSLSQESADNSSAVTIPVAAPAAPKAAVPAQSFDRSGHGIAKQDEHEAEAIREQVVSKMVTPDIEDMGKAIDNAVGLLSVAYGKGLAPELAARLSAVIESRLRGVRSRAETSNLLARDANGGGIGLGPVMAGALSEELEKYMADIHGEKEAAIKEEKEAFVKKSVKSAAAKDESRRTGEQEELDRMYGALTGRKDKVVSAQIPNNNDQITKKSEIPNPQIQKIEPPTSPYLYKPPTVAPLPVSTVKTMSDIRPAAPSVRLTGPVEELRNMALADFRRLSGDPAQACRKVLDKLDLLEEHSFAQRIEGAKAWRESEIYRLYLKIITASFSNGKPIQAVVAAAMAANEPTLTEREVHAIMEMNRQLKA